MTVCAMLIETCNLLGTQFNLLQAYPLEIPLLHLVETPTNCLHFFYEQVSCKFHLSACLNRRCHGEVDDNFRSPSEVRCFHQSCIL